MVLTTWSIYNYVIQYKPGQENQVTDANYHCRIVLTVHLHQEKPLIKSLKDTPINIKQAERWTAHGPVLSKVRHRVENGWSHDIGEKLAQYKHREMELSVARGYLL